MSFISGLAAPPHGKNYSSFTGRWLRRAQSGFVAKLGITIIEGSLPIQLIRHGRKKSSVWSLGRHLKSAATKDLL
jgi:hypothetical protein